MSCCVFVVLVVVRVVVSAMGVGKCVVCERAMRVACRGVRTFGLQRCCEGESEGADARHFFVLHGARHSCGVGGASTVGSASSGVDNSLSDCDTTEEGSIEKVSVSDAAMRDT